MSKTVQPSDEFMELLTDALRAGPGSPEWHHALTQIRQQGGSATADEHQLLWAARERLASGKEYRSVKAGPGFTRRLLEGIDRIPAARKPRMVPIATLIAVVAVLVLIGVAAIVAYWVYGPHAAVSNPGRDLSSLVFSDSVVDDHFTGDLRATGWRTIGSLPVAASDQGLRAGDFPASAKDYLGGGVVGQIPLSPTNPFSLEVTFTGHANGSVIPQIFITDHPDFSLDRATTPHELVWTIQDGQAQMILPTGHVADSPREPITDSKTQVRLVISRDTAFIETNGHPLYTGPHDLLPDQPRYIGVRFIAKAGAKSDLVFTSLRVQKPAPVR